HHLPPLSISVVEVAWNELQRLPFDWMRLRQIAIARERIKWKRISVQVILQIEDARKSRSRKRVLIPRTIIVLTFYEPRHRALHRGIVWTLCCQQSDKSPRCLRRCAFSLAFETRVVIRSARFAEAAIFVLYAAQPMDATPALCAFRKTQRFGGPEDATRPVHVIRSPASVPRAFLGLLALQIQYSAPYRWIRRGPAKFSEAFNRARSHVRRGRIDHRVMISKRNLRQQHMIVVAIKCAPAAVVVLHAEQPSKPPSRRLRVTLRFRMRHVLQSHQHKCRVIHVRIEIVPKFKRPSSRCRILILHLPVAGSKNLMIEQPLRRAS